MYYNIIHSGFLGVAREVMNLYLRNFADAFGDKEVLLIMDQAGWHRSRELVVPSTGQPYGRHNHRTQPDA